MLFFMVVRWEQGCLVLGVVRVQSWKKEWRVWEVQENWTAGGGRARDGDEGSGGNGWDTHPACAESQSWASGRTLVGHFDCCVSCLQAAFTPFAVPQDGKEGSPWYCKSGTELCQRRLGSERKAGLKLCPVLFSSLVWFCFVLQKYTILCVTMGN